MGRDTTTPSRRRTSGSGVAPTTVQCSAAQEVEVRARVHEPQHPVQVEGIGAEIEVEALRQHHLEDVPGPDELLGAAARRLGTPPRTWSAVTSGGTSSGRGASSGGPPNGTGEVGGEIVEACPGRVEGGRCLGVAPVLPDDHVVHEHDALAPVVEGAQLPDHVQDGVGEAGVVTGHVGEMLDLAHDVVAEIAHEPPVQRGQVGERPGTGRR